MSRVAAIDRLFSDQARTYLNIQNALSSEPDIAHSQPGGLVDEFTLNLRLASHYACFRKVILESEFVYVHTVNAARYVTPFMGTGKVVVDVHGITPEEQELCGQPAHAEFYREIEKCVLNNCENLVVVTEAMAQHFKEKYPQCKARFIVAPIFDPSYEAVSADKRTPSGQQKTVIYSGSLHPWQNVTLMLDAAAALHEKFYFKFLTNETDLLSKLAAERGLEGKISIGSASKKDLPMHYLAADYGFALRDDIAVNRVSCPTKLSEYLWFGIIPIVLSPRLGDFSSFGYRYLTYNDFLSGNLPSIQEESLMVESNRQAIGKLQAVFKESSGTIKELKRLIPHRQAEEQAFLSDYERNIAYPCRAKVDPAFV